MCPFMTFGQHFMRNEVVGSLIFNPFRVRKRVNITDRVIKLYIHANILPPMPAAA